LEEQANATGYYTQRYVWSPAYVNEMIDRDTDTSGTGLTPTGASYTRIWAINDAGFNVVALVTVVDSVVTVVERYEYDPFGNITVLSGDYEVEDGSSYNWVYGFQGMRMDTITGDNLSRTREDDPEVGRWASEDPFGLAAGDNDLYRFEGNSPRMYVDPSGLQRLDLSAETAAMSGLSEFNAPVIPDIIAPSIFNIQLPIMPIVQPITQYVWQQLFLQQLAQVLGGPNYVQKMTANTLYIQYLYNQWMMIQNVENDFRNLTKIIDKLAYLTLKSTIFRELFSKYILYSVRIRNSIWKTKMTVRNKIMDAIIARNKFVAETFQTPPPLQNQGWFQMETRPGWIKNIAEQILKE
jgi:RHS repeat-associated protein